MQGQGQPILGLDEKIQRLINNYTEIKSNYESLLVVKTELEKDNYELIEVRAANSQRLIDIEEKINKQEEEIEFLRNENRNLRQQIENYDVKTKSALSKIDGILSQISEL